MRREDRLGGCHLALMGGSQYTELILGSVLRCWKSLVNLCLLVLLLKSKTKGFDH